MTATLKVVHKAIDVEVRRGAYDILVDGVPVGNVKMNHTTSVSIDPGRHTLQVRHRRSSSRPVAIEAAEGQTLVYRCTGKSFLPVFLLSFVVRSFALHLRRVH